MIIQKKYQLCGSGWKKLALVGCLIFAPGLSSPAGAQAPPDNPGQQIKESVLTQLGLLISEKKSRTPAQKKLDSQLVLTIKERRTRALPDGMPKLRRDVKIAGGDLTQVDIKAKVTSGLLNRIKQLGGQIVNSHPEYSAIRAWMPVSALEAVAGRADVKFIRPADELILNTGSVNSEGDVTHRAKAARTNFGVTGAGVTVGVMSDSIDFIQNSQSRGDLGTVFVLPKRAGFGQSGEGTAMLEIVHDIAPGAKLIFASGSGGEAQMARSIRDLRAAGCDIIVDDISYPAESPFQDGPISQAVNAVCASGALFFSSAGNSGNKSDNTSSTWEGNFVSGGPLAIGGVAVGELHLFAPGVGANKVRPGGSSRSVGLFWADPLGASTNDYDVYVIDATNSFVVSASTNTQGGNEDPYESIGSIKPGEFVVIAKFSGAKRFLHLDVGRGQLQVSTPGRVRGHNAAGAADAFSVAATPASDPTGPFPSPFNATNKVETFSSDGPRRIFFKPNGVAITPGNFLASGGQVLKKPDITAADGVVTTLASNSGLNPFFGTSAAAPHAAAIAALLKSRNPNLTGAQIRAALTNTAIDIEAPGFDRDSGAGIINALQAIGSVPVGGSIMMASRQYSP